MNPFETDDNRLVPETRAAWGWSTSMLHNGNERDEATGASSFPIFQVSTFHQEHMPDFGEYTYARSENPTRHALENTIAELEKGAAGFAFASGIAAVSSSISAFVSAGDHVVATRDLYGGTHRILTNFFSRYGVLTTFVDPTDLKAWENAITPKTKLLVLETPSNPLLRITDVQGVCKIARKHGVKTIMDNTFSTPYLHQPLKQGVDVVVHSATKFLGGHSDVVAGLAVAATDEDGKKIYAIQNSFGAILGPQDCFLLLRGIRTLGVRMDRQQASALQIAQWLQTQNWVKAVHYPGLIDHPGYAVHQAQARGPGAVLSFECTDDAQALQLMQHTKLCMVAVSLGGVESILSWPERMSHAAIPVKERRELGVTPRLLRLSVGLEDAADLQDDLLQASHA